MNTNMLLLLMLGLVLSMALALGGRSNIGRALAREVPSDWIFFNLLMLTVGALAIRLLDIDIDPYRVRIAQLLTDERTINLQEISPTIETIRHVFRLDTDQDQENEWLVVYRYDVPAKPGMGPYGAMIYDADRCRPPALATYELRPYDYDYLAENIGTARLAAPTIQDVAQDGQVEIVVKFRYSSLAIFRWFDDTADCNDTDPGKKGYRLLGNFRGTGGVTLDPASGRVTVVDRGIFERSQLGVKRVYRPDSQGSYLRSDGKGLADPVDSWVDFAVGEPLASPQTYYPEKAVLSFYIHLGQDNFDAARYLCEDTSAAANFVTDSFGIGQTPGSYSKVRIKEIRYQPDERAEQNLEQREVTVVTVPKLLNGSDGGRRVITWKVNSVPEMGALPHNTRWCLSELVSAHDAPTALR
jgi:hypothetical protein